MASDPAAITEPAPLSWKLPPQQSLPELVEQRITDAINAGELKPGERIVEMHLARKLGVSRPVLREALRTLEANFVVVSTHGRGTYVASMETSQVVQMMIHRATLEGTAARLIAGRLSVEALSNLKRQVREMERAAATGRIVEWREMDWRFHESICVLADNQFLLAAWRSISNLIKLYVRTHQDHDRFKSRVLTNHEECIDALASGDPDHAEFVFRRSILTGVFLRFGLPMPKSFASFMVDTK